MADFPTAKTEAVDNTTDVLAKHINNIEDKVGIDSSADADSLDYRVGIVEDAVYTWKGAWVTATAYVLNDTIEEDGSGYVCIEAHTSGTFATDLAASKWELYVTGVDADSIASAIVGVAGKTTPIDADTVPLIDSAAANVLKELTWANLKATIKSYYDSVTATLTNKTLTNPIINYTDTTIGMNVKCRVYLNADQINLTHDTPTKVLLDLEGYDTGADFASYKFTAPVDGYYYVMGRICFLTPIANSTYITYIYVNGSSVAETRESNGPVISRFTVETSDILYLAANQYVELYAEAATAGDEDTVDIDNGVTGNRTCLVIHLLST